MHPITYWLDMMLCATVLPTRAARMLKSSSLCSSDKRFCRFTSRSSASFTIYYSILLIYSSLLVRSPKNTMNL